MEEKMINVINEMAEVLNVFQLKRLQEVLLKTFGENQIQNTVIMNEEYMKLFTNRYNNAVCYSQSKQCEGIPPKVYSVIVKSFFE